MGTFLSTVNRIVSDALSEDVGKKDITTSAIIPKDKKGKAEIIAKENCVIAGIEIAKTVLIKLDKKASFISKVKDGESIEKSTVIAEIKGELSSILTAERVMLNFLQRLSGIATSTSKYVKEAYPVKIMDTRKTTPNLRLLEKYAVKVGGGLNHRFNLNSAILIKDNHIKAAGSIKNAVNSARKRLRSRKIEVEVDSLKKVKDTIGLNPDIIMLDNMNIKNIKKAVKMIKDYCYHTRNKIKIEVSGRVNLKNVSKIARTGVDFISVGALTHSVKAIDISLEIK